MKLIKFFIIIIIFSVLTYFYVNNMFTGRVSEGNNLKEIPQSNIDRGIQQAVDGINLPEGFKISYFAINVPNARSMVISEAGIVYVGTRDQGKIYALVDHNGDYIADKVTVVDEKLNSPNGVAVKNGDLYVAEINRILKYDDIDNTYMSDPDYEIIYDEYPKDASHGWKYIAFGPDGFLYVPVGAPCNVCERNDEIYSTITRIDDNGDNLTVIATGIRNTVGFDWHPLTGELWFTDNGRDWLGDDLPPDELNRISETTQNFGFPYCHGKDIKDPDVKSDKTCGEFTSPEVELGPHVAALGISFYNGDMFPENYKNKLFIAEHGSWNRKEPIGYRISTVDLSNDGKSANNYKVFAEGWLKDGEAWGRPVDVIQFIDGSILVSDDKAGAVYRITYSD